MGKEKKSGGITESVLEAYEKLVASVPDLERKGKSMPYTSVNGHMFSFLDKEGMLSLRLDNNDREKFLKKYSTSLSIQHGRVMKEYVLVPVALQSNLPELQPYFQSSYTYTSSLKPKPTKKKK